MKRLSPYNPRSRAYVDLLRAGREDAAHFRADVGDRRVWRDEQERVRAAAADVQRRVLRCPDIVHGGDRYIHMPDDWHDDGPTRGGCRAMLFGALATVAVVVGAVMMARGGHL